MRKFKAQILRIHQKKAIINQNSQIQRVTIRPMQPILQLKHWVHFHLTGG